MSIIAKFSAAAVAAGTVMIPASVLSETVAAAGALGVQVAAHAQNAVAEPELRADGRVVAARSVALAFEQTGRLAWMVEPGAVVKSGDPVLRLDSARAQAAVDVARAEVRRAELHLRHAQTVADRTARLAERSTATRNSLTDALMDRDLARADLERARASLVDAELDLEGRTLRAPFDGAVVRATAQIGEYVEDGTEIVRFECLSEVEVLVELPTGAALQLAKGDAVRVSLGTEQETQGTVRLVLPFVTEHEGYWGGPEPFGLVKIAIPDDASAPGLPATVLFASRRTD